MREFDFTITHQDGLHARLAGLLVKTAKVLDSDITVTKGDKTVGATKLMALMGLCAKCGDTIKVTINGGDEENNEKTVYELLEKELT